MVKQDAKSRLYVQMTSDNQSSTVTQNSNKIAIHLIQYTTNRSAGEVIRDMNSVHCSTFRIVLSCHGVLLYLACLVMQLETETLLTHNQTKYRF